ncbi:hypothetical protein COO60DRAFT_167880 [Scenedesmus sp. NREL 46B-D3]|nr:hypothetical protein COO60DRAFT_167880 [Scenedesmus sp. NREL 46B-D3]
MAGHMHGMPCWRAWATHLLLPVPWRVCCACRTLSCARQTVPWCCCHTRPAAAGSPATHVTVGSSRHTLVVMVPEGWAGRTPAAAPGPKLLLGIATATAIGGGCSNSMRLAKAEPGGSKEYRVCWADGLYGFAIRCAEACTTHSCHQMATPCCKACRPPPLRMTPLLPVHSAAAPRGVDACKPGQVLSAWLL